MGILSWLYGKGIAGAIARDIVRKYLTLKHKHPKEENKTTVKRVWELWLTLNEEAIRAEDGIDKNVRLDIIKDQIKEGFDKEYLYNSLFDLYLDVLYVETEISVNDGKIYDNAMQVFVKEASKFNLNFSNELEHMRNTMKHVGLRP